MRVLWTLVKVIIGLAVAIPLCFIVLATALGIVGTLVALAFFALRIAIVGALGYGAYRLIRHLLTPARKPEAPAVRELPAADPYYEAAMRELDAELGRTARS